MSAEPFRAACNAMGTRFEILLWGGSEHRLQAAAREALEEIERLHCQLSAFDPASDIWDINERAAWEPVLVEPRLFALLERCLGLSTQTHGAFDVTIGGLMAAWGFRDALTASSRQSDPSQGRVGSSMVVLDRDACTVRFAAQGLSLDLGGVAKGYALEAAAAILTECRIGGALIHGGTSSVLGLGTDPSGQPWRVGIRRPGTTDRANIIAAANLRDRALGVSAQHGRMAGAAGHIMDPRSGRPAEGISLAAVACPSATEADAFSTALLVLGSSFADELRSMGHEAWLFEAAEQP